MKIGKAASFLVLLLTVILCGCASTGKRAIYVESAEPDGIWTLSGWLIRQYEDLEMRPAYDNVAQTARHFGWKPQDRSYGKFESEIEYEAADGTAVAIRIWVPAGGPTEVGIQFARGDGRAISGDFLNQLEQITVAKRTK